jgi:hypothetical protein
VQGGAGALALVLGSPVRDTEPVISSSTAAHGYEMFRDKADGCIEVVLKP